MPLISVPAYGSPPYLATLDRSVRLVNLSSTIRPHHFRNVDLGLRPNRFNCNVVAQAVHRIGAGLLREEWGTGYQSQKCILFFHRFVSIYIWRGYLQIEGF